MRKPSFWRHFCNSIDKFQSSYACPSCRSISSLFFLSLSCSARHCFAFSSSLFRLSSSFFLSFSNFSTSLGAMFAFRLCHRLSSSSLRLLSCAARSSTFLCKKAFALGGSSHNNPCRRNSRSRKCSHPGGKGTEVGRPRQSAISGVIMTASKNPKSRRSVPVSRQKIN